MAHNKILNLTVTFLLVTISLADFPADPKPCSYGDTECIKNFITFLLKEKTDGYAPLNIPSMDPSKISQLNMKQGKESPVYIDLKFRDGELYGFKGSKITRVKGFGKNMAQTHEIDITANQLSLISDYTIKGRVLIIPISGTGKSNLTMENVTLKITLHGEEVVKEGKTYLHIKKLDLIVDPTRFWFDFQNLFNGDKALGDTTNLFLNENWKDIYSEVRGSVQKGFATVYKHVINGVLDKFPIDTLFASE